MGTGLPGTEGNTPEDQPSIKRYHESAIISVFDQALRNPVEESWPLRKLNKAILSARSWDGLRLALEDCGPDSDEPGYHEAQHEAD